MGEGQSHWSSMVLRKSQTCFSDRHTHPNSMYSNFCHVLKTKNTELTQLDITICPTQHYDLPNSTLRFAQLNTTIGTNLPKNFLAKVS